MKITSEGNVVVGGSTTATIARMEVSSDLSAGAITDTALFYQNSTSNPTIGQGVRVYLAANKSVTRAAAIQANVTSGTNGHSLSLLTNANGAAPTEKLIIDPIGNITQASGNFTAPNIYANTALVSGTVTANTALNAGTANVTGTIYVGGISANGAITQTVNSNTSFTNMSLGNINTGTLADTRFQLSNGGNSTTYIIRGQNYALGGQANWGIIAHGGTAPFTIYVGGAERFRLNGDGSINMITSGTTMYVPNLQSNTSVTATTSVIGGTITSNGAATIRGSTNTNGLVTSTLGGTVGYTQLTTGDATHSGYISFYSQFPYRQGYIGFSSTNNSTTDTGTVPFVIGNSNFTGNVIVGSSTAAVLTDEKLRVIGNTVIGSTNNPSLKLSLDAVPTVNLAIASETFQGRTTTGVYSAASSIVTYAAEAWNTTRSSGYLSFNTTTRGQLAVSEKMRIDANGDIYNFSGNTIVPKTSGYGIKVDPAAPTYPWADLLCPIIVRGVGATDPSWNTFRNGIKSYQFTVNDEYWTTVHLPHDLVPNSNVYWHTHWAATTAPTSGGVAWGFEMSYAKGHQQGAFPASVTNSVFQTANTTAYTHHIAEMQISTPGGSATLLDSNLLEPDGMILIRTYLLSNNIAPAQEPFLFQSDMHYQSTGIGTKQKAPGFYT